MRCISASSLLTSIEPATPPPGALGDGVSDRPTDECARRSASAGRNPPVWCGATERRGRSRRSSCGVAVSKPTTSSIPGSFGIGDREAVRDHADHDQPRVDARRPAVVRAAPGPGGRRPPRSPSRCRSRTCRPPAPAPARTASAARSRCRRTAGPTPPSRRRPAAAAARSRAASGRRRAAVPLPAAACLPKPPLPAKKPTIS